MSSSAKGGKAQGQFIPPTQLSSTQSQQVIRFVGTAFPAASNQVYWSHFLPLTVPLELPIAQSNQYIICKNS